MKIVNTGWNYRHPKDFRISRPHGSGDYLLLLLKSEATFFLEEGQQMAAPNTVILYRKGTPQLYGAASGDFCNDWLHIELEEAEVREIEALDIPMDTLIPVDSVNQLSELLKNIFQECYSQNLCREESMALYFRLLMRKLAEKRKTFVPGREMPYHEELCALRSEIRLAPQKPWSVEAISRKLKLSRSYMQHLYKAYFGIPVMTEVTNCRMEYARYLLSSTDYRVRHIAEMCGYESDVHFMRQFKKSVGITPSEYRTQHELSRT